MTEILYVSNFKRLSETNSSHKISHYYNELTQKRKLISQVFGLESAQKLTKMTKITRTSEVVTFAVQFIYTGTIS